MAGIIPRVTVEMWVILTARVAGSLPVLRWAFAGAVIAILVDLSDLFLRAYLTLGGVRNYQSFDKWCDQVYLACFLLAAVRWDGPARAIAVALYAFRLVGFDLFELTGDRRVLFLFPNVFEFWFLFAAFTRRWWPSFSWRRGPTAVALATATAAKLAHEYALHIGRWFDAFTARDVVEWLLSPFG